MHQIRLRAPSSFYLLPRLSLALAISVMLSACVATAPNLERGKRVSPYGTATAPMKPPFESSDEANRYQLRLAQEQGYADQATLRWLLSQAPVGAEMAAGEYLVAYRLTAPQGDYELRDGRLVWQEPTSANARINVYVRDGADGRIVPGALVRATWLDPTGGTIATQVLPFGWDPVLHHYGANVQLPPGGPYRLHLEIAPPNYRRHDPVNGDRYTDKAVADFTDIHIDPTALAQVPARDTAMGEQLARQQGEVLMRSLHEMIDNTAVDGAYTRVGDYLIAYAVEYAEGYWRPHGGDLRYKIRVEASAETNAHVEVAVLDARTGRFIPGLAIQASLYDSKGKALGTQPEPFMWHPWLYHYGENWRVPGTGRYRIHIRVEPPGYPRYGRELGNQFAQPVEVDFSDVFIHTGQK